MRIKFVNEINRNDAREYNARRVNCFNASRKKAGFVGLKRGDVQGSFALMMPDGTPISTLSTRFDKCWTVSRVCYENMIASLTT